MDDKIIRKIKLKTKDCQLTVKVKIPSDYVININQSDLLSERYNYGFFKLKSLKRNRLEFLGPIGISLYEKLKKPISEYDAFLILEQIVDIIHKIEKLGLSRNNLLLDTKYTFFNESTKELTFIYLPIATPHGGMGVLEAIDQVIYSMKPAEEDSNYLSNFSYFIKKLDKFDAEKIEAYIYKVNKDIVNLIKKEDITDVFENKTIKRNGDAQKQKESEVDDEKTELMSANGVDTEQFLDYRQSIFQAGGKRVVGIVDDESTCIMDEDATVLLEDEKTEVFFDESADPVGFPFLIRTQTEEIIRINKSVFRIGKEENCVDYVVADNVAISRSHADIISRAGKYFVFDLRSKNKTYINNRVLPAEHEVEICNGDILKLANEEFLFQV